MAGTAQYTPTQIYWLLLQWYHWKIRSIHILGPEFERIFGRPLVVQQLKYVTTKYGKDPDYGCPYYDANPPHPKTSDGAELENVPLGPASNEAHAAGTRSRRLAAIETPAARQRDIRANLPYEASHQTTNMASQTTNLPYDANNMPNQTNTLPYDTSNMPSQMMEISGNARQEPNGGSSAVTETRQLTATRSTTSHDQCRPRQTAPAFVPAMPTASRAPRRRRRLDLSRGLAWQQAHIDAQADERIEQQLQQRLYMQQMQQTQQIQHAWQLQQLLHQAQGMPVSYHPASNFLDHWPQSRNLVLTQHAQHAQHAQHTQLDQPMRQYSGFTHPETFVGGGPALTANRYPGQLLLEAESLQQVHNVVAQQWHPTPTQHLPEMGPRVTEMLEAGNEAASDAVPNAAEPSLWEVPEQGAVEQSIVEQVAAAETEATQQEVGALPEETREEPEAPSSPAPAESQQQNLMLSAEAEEEEVNFFDLLRPLTNSANEPLLGDDPADFDFTEVDAMAREAEAMTSATIGQSNTSQVHEEAPVGTADNFSFEDFLNATEDQDYVFFPPSDNPESLTEPPNED